MRLVVYATLGYFVPYCVSITREMTDPYDFDHAIDEPYERLCILTDSFEGQEIIMPITRDAVAWLTALRDQADAALARLESHKNGADS